jgi:hypothetical protein
MTERSFIDSLPPVLGLGFETLRGEGGITPDEFNNGYMLDENGKRIAVIRAYFANKHPETLREDFESGLEELKYLEAAGIKIAGHVPVFVGPNSDPYLLVEYIDGEELSSAVVLQYQDECMELLKKLDYYAVDAIASGRGVLTDISSSFQYVMRNGEPVLVDLDMYQYPVARDAKERCILAGYILEELSEGSGFTPTEQNPDYSLVLPALSELSKL